MEFRPILLAILAAGSTSACDNLRGKPEGSAEERPDRSHAALMAEARRKPPRDCTQDFSFMAASGKLGGALEQIEAGDHRRANILLRDGLEVLGDVSLGDDVLDHSGQKLSFAWGEEWEGRLEPAAEVRQRILAQRLTNYAKLQNLERCPTPQEAAKMDLPAPIAASR